MTSTSYFPAARTRSSPFRTPAQPHSGTVETSYPFSSLASRRGKHSSSRTRTVHQRFACVLERCDGLISGYRGKVFDKIVDPVAGFEIVEEILHRNSRADEHGGSPEDFRIGVNNCFHLAGPHDLISRIYANLDPSAFRASSGVSNATRIARGGRARRLRKRAA